MMLRVLLPGMRRGMSTAMGIMITVAPGPGRTATRTLSAVRVLLTALPATA
jgi:hypothetical protein